MTPEQARALLQDYAKAAAAIDAGLAGMEDRAQITVTVGSLRKLTRIVRTFASALDARLERKGVRG